ncbi:MAG: aminotransferase class V-fold PLP-dependent enzyme [Verrucomicrobia bacterium]|nr:aminotransferase class V-fold PLP-dependent enzyme [Verrucomicrobiota bacterium]
MSTHELLEQPAVPPQLWPLDAAVVFLNHGSFGSCPRHVLEHQEELRRRLERRPVEFFVRDLEGLLDGARAELARFLGAEADDLIFVPNATAGVNTVLRSLRFERGDELLVTDHEYNACRNALNFVAECAGAAVVEAPVPFPLKSAEDIVGAVLARVTPRTRLVLLDHVTSQTGLVFPIRRLVAELAGRGIDTLVDGAHAPGMVPLDLREVGAAYYTGNCHKWLCAPKGAAFLHVRRDRQRLIRPLSISHGANSTRSDRSLFQIEFGWTGTWDPTALLSVGESLRYVGALLPGGWPGVMQRNRALALAGRRLLCEALHISPPCPDECIGSLASVPLPDSADNQPPASPLYADPLLDQLRLDHHIEVPVIPWPAPPKRLLRISAQLYNALPQYRRLAEALGDFGLKR